MGKLRKDGNPEGLKLKGPWRRTDTFEAQKQGPSKNADGVGQVRSGMERVKETQVELSTGQERKAREEA